MKKTLLLLLPLLVSTSAMANLRGECIPGYAATSPDLTPDTMKICNTTDDHIYLYDAHGTFLKEVVNSCYSANMTSHDEENGDKPTIHAYDGTDVNKKAYDIGVFITNPASANFIGQTEGSCRATVYDQVGLYVINKTEDYCNAVGPTYWVHNCAYRIDDDGKGVSK